VSSERCADYHHARRPVLLPTARSQKEEGVTRICTTVGFPIVLAARGAFFTVLATFNCIKVAFT
jgi:hypothetical protein